jgi:hypothetical protein
MSSPRTRHFTVLALALSLVRGYAEARQSNSVNVARCATAVAGEYYEPEVSAITERGTIKPEFAGNRDRSID